MTDKSINASERLETSTSVVDFVLSGGMYGSIFSPETNGSCYPASRANNPPASGINPTHSIETKVQ